MGMQNTPDIETIRAAVAGEAWALEKVLACYDDEINRLVCFYNSYSVAKFFYYVKANCKLKISKKEGIQTLLKHFCVIIKRTA